MKKSVESMTLDELMAFRLWCVNKITYVDYLIARLKGEVKS